MDVIKNSERAVLTGDIVHSSLLKPRDRQSLFEAFPKLSALLRERYPDEVSGTISNFRGDGWQLVVDHPGRALEISLFVRTYLRFAVTEKKIDSRVTIGIGLVEFAPADNVSAGYGAAYTVSGHLLESLPASQRMAVGFSRSALPGITSGAVILVELLDAIVTPWGASQSQAVYWALQGLTQAEIATRWQPAPISQPSISSSLRRASWPAVKNSLACFNELVEATSYHINEVPPGSGR